MLSASSYDHFTAAKEFRSQCQMLSLHISVNVKNLTDGRECCEKFANANKLFVHVGQFFKKNTVRITNHLQITFSHHLIYFLFYLSRANGVQSTPTHPKGGAPRTGRTCTVQCPWSLGEVARIRRSGGRATLTKFAPWRPPQDRGGDPTSPPAP